MRNQVFKRVFRRLTPLEILRNREISAKRDKIRIIKLSTFFYFYRVDLIYCFVKISLSKSLKKFFSVKGESGVNPGLCRNCVPIFRYFAEEESQNALKQTIFSY